MNQSDIGAVEEVDGKLSEGTKIHTFPAPDPLQPPVFHIPTTHRQQSADLTALPTGQLHNLLRQDLLILHMYRSGWATTL